MKTYLNAEFPNIVIYHDLPECKTKCERWVFHTLPGECIGNYLYLFGIDNNSICKIEKSTGNIVIQSGYSTELYATEYLCMKSVAYNHIIYFISEKTASILKFNTISNQKEYIYFDNEEIDYDPVICGKRLYLLPVGYSERFPCVDIECNQLIYILTNYEMHINSNFKNIKYIYGYSIIVNNCIYRGSYLEPYIQKFHINSRMFEYIYVKGLNRPIKSIAFDGEFFWILSNSDGMLIKWDEKNNKIITFIDLAKETQKKGMLYTACAYTNGSIYIPEQKGYCLLELRIKENLLFSYDCSKIPGFKIKISNDQPFAEAIRTDQDGRIYFFPYRANGVLVKDKQEKTIFYKTETFKMLENINGQQMYNEYICLLEHFCDKVSQISQKNVVISDVGRKILQNILGEMYQVGESKTKA